MFHLECLPLWAPSWDSETEPGLAGWWVKATADVKTPYHTTMLIKKITDNLDGMCLLICW